MCCTMHRMWKTFFDEKWRNIMGCTMNSKCSKYEIRFLTRKSDETSCAVPWTRSAVNVRNAFWRKGNSSDIMWYTMNSKCSQCEKRFWRKGYSTNIMVWTMDRMWQTFLTKRKFIRHYVPYHELDVAWNVKNFFDEKESIRHYGVYHELEVL